jgi:hypothetical protein
LSLVTFFGNNLDENHTPHCGSIARDIEKTSMFESAQTIIGGMKENSQSSKLPTQSWGMIKKIQKIQKI